MSIPSQEEKIKKNKEKYKQILAEQMAKLLMKRGMQNIDEWHLHYLVHEVAKTTPLDDGMLCEPPPYPIKETFMNRTGDKRITPQEGYSTGFSPEKSGSLINDISSNSPKTHLTTQKRSSKNGNDELDDLTMDELKSLLDNFKNLSKSEQIDLIAYMKKLETSNPNKVRQLKSSFSSAMLARADGNDDQNGKSDGLGSAMLQVLARNMHRFTNDNNISKVETHHR